MLATLCDADPVGVPPARERHGIDEHLVGQRERGGFAFEYRVGGLRIALGDVGGLELEAALQHVPQRPVPHEMEGQVALLLEQLVAERFAAEHLAEHHLGGRHDPVRCQHDEGRAALVEELGPGLASRELGQLELRVHGDVLDVDLNTHLG